MVLRVPSIMTTQHDRHKRTAVITSDCAGPPTGQSGMHTVKKDLAIALEAANM